MRRIVNRVITRAGARVEHLATHGAVGDQLLHDRLRPADVPWDRRLGRPLAAVELLEHRVDFVCHDGNLPTPRKER
jgi:hypothetical protein